MRIKKIQNWCHLWGIWCTGIFMVLLPSREVHCSVLPGWDDCHAMTDVTRVARANERNFCRRKLESMEKWIIHTAVTRLCHLILLPHQPIIITLLLLFRLFISSSSSASSSAIAKTTWLVPSLPLSKWKLWESLRKRELLKERVWDVQRVMIIMAWPGWERSLQRQYHRGGGWTSCVRDGGMLRREECHEKKGGSSAKGATLVPMFGTISTGKGFCHTVRGVPKDGDCYYQIV